jgi:hypothetical protein
LALSTASPREPAIDAAFSRGSCREDGFWPPCAPREPRHVPLGKSPWCKNLPSTSPTKRRSTSFQVRGRKQGAPCDGRRLRPPCPGRHTNGISFPSHSANGLLRFIAGIIPQKCHGRQTEHSRPLMQTPSPLPPLAVAREAPFSAIKRRQPPLNAAASRLAPPPSCRPPS